MEGDALRNSGVWSDRIKRWEKPLKKVRELGSRECPAHPSVTVLSGKSRHLPNPKKGTQWRRETGLSLGGTGRETPFPPFLALSRLSNPKIYLWTYWRIISIFKLDGNQIEIFSDRGERGARLSAWREKDVQRKYDKHVIRRKFRKYGEDDRRLLSRGSPHMYRATTQILF